jgi:hypothetical protein
MRYVNNFVLCSMTIAPTFRSGTGITQEFLWALAHQRCEGVETPEDIGFQTSTS